MLIALDENIREAQASFSSIGVARTFRGRPLDASVIRDADIICVDLNALHMQPALDIPALLVYSAQGSDVKMTMVDGRILYENGQYHTLDKERVIADFKKSCDRLLGI